MALEFNKNAYQAAIKKALRRAFKESKGWGLFWALWMVYGKADMLAETLPHGIATPVFRFMKGTNETSLTLTTPDCRGPRYQFYNVKKDQTLFHTFTSLENESLVTRDNGGSAYFGFWCRLSSKAAREQVVGSPVWAVFNSSALDPGRVQYQPCWPACARGANLAFSQDKG